MKEIKKNGSFEDVETVMDRMMQIPIIGLGKTDFCDPNLIMDLRHDFIKRPQLNYSQPESTLTAVNLTAIRKAREEHLLQLELRRFEKQLLAARPKFHQLRSCKKNAISNSDDVDFWESVLYNKLEEINSDNSKLHSDTNEDSLSENQTENSEPPNIKVTIKDKPNMAESLEEKKNLVRRVFRIWKMFVEEKKYYRDLVKEVQDHISRKLLQRTFSSWKSEVDKSKAFAQKKKAESEMSHERKIAIFVNAIAKKQEELIKLQKLNNKKEVRMKSAPECTQVNARSTVLVRQVCIVESPAQNRLKAQQKIIEEQRMKLTKQRQIIEELQLKEFQDQSRKISDKTLEAAKDILDYCGPRTKRTLLQLMKEKGYSAKSEDKQRRVPNPPEFLTRMESRAEARKERVKRAKEAREKKLKEEKRREELLKKEQDEERKKIQREAQKEARRIRKKQERQKIEQLERQRILMEKCEQFYQRLLLRNYFLFPFKFLLQLKADREDRAVNFYHRVLLKRHFSLWREFTKTIVERKISSATFYADKNLLSQVFSRFRISVLETRNNLQVAQDFSDIKLLIKTCRLWKNYATEEVVKNIEKEKIASEHYIKLLLKRSFVGWTRYLEIAEELRESEQRKDELRAVVQQVIPDFDPKRWGVAID